MSVDTRISSDALPVQVASDWLHASAGASGAVVLFSGLVRDERGDVSLLALEHYPGMSERVLAELAQQVMAVWPLQRVLAWHRVGAMAPGEVIVLVGVASAHREAAFEAASCLMDLVKTRVPLWKRVQGAGGMQWVDARDKDLTAAARWADRFPLPGQ